MPVLDTVANTAIGSALSSKTVTSGLLLSNLQSVDSQVVVVATAVTSGATLQIEVTTPDTGKWQHTCTFTVTANGSYAIPLRAHKATGANTGNTSVRVNCTSYTDGTYTNYLTTVTKTAT